MRTTRKNRKEAEATIKTLATMTKLPIPEHKTGKCVYTVQTLQELYPHMYIKKPASAATLTEQGKSTLCPHYIS